MAPASSSTVVATASLMTNIGMTGIGVWLDRQRG